MDWNVSLEQGQRDLKSTVEHECGKTGEDAVIQQQDTGRQGDDRRAQQSVGRQGAGRGQHSLLQLWRSKGKCLACLGEWSRKYPWRLWKNKNLNKLSLCAVFTSVFFMNSWDLLWHLWFLSYYFVVYLPVMELKWCSLTHSWLRSILFFMLQLTGQIIIKKRMGWLSQGAVCHIINRWRAYLM